MFHCLQALWPLFQTYLTYPVHLYLTYTVINTTVILSLGQFCWQGTSSNVWSHLRLFYWVQRWCCPWWIQDVVPAECLWCNEKTSYQPPQQIWPQMSVASRLRYHVLESKINKESEFLITSYEAISSCPFLLLLVFFPKYLPNTHFLWGSSCLIFCI